MARELSLARRLEGLVPIGLGPDGTTRLAWTDEDRAARAWFAGQAEALGLTVERDPAGNLWAVPDLPPPWWAAGSHLDSVRAGGCYDGALGVAAAFEAAAHCPAPVCVISFADEEGARFNTPTFGSRALAGRLDPAVLDRRDAEGVQLRDALAGFGVDPDGVGEAASLRPRLRGFLELHIDQGTRVAARGVSFGVASALVARLRAVASFGGRADHAGTAAMDGRRDALLAAARLIVRADALARERPGMVATAGRILVEPNAPTTVPAHARVWLDARSPDPAQLDDWLAQVRPAAPGLDVQSRSDPVAFDPGVRSALAQGSAPEVACYAGHDAGILAPLLPAGMLLVRNRSGVSHAPDERVGLDDAAAATAALAAALEALA